MGQKVNPIGLRIGITRTWDSVWFSKEDYKKLATIIPASKSKVLIQFLKFTQNRMGIIRLLFKVLVLAQR